MTTGRELGGRYSEDPIGSESRGKNRERRKHKLDGPTLTPTEAHIKNNLMKQFCHLEGGTNSEAYKTSPAWCSGCNGRRLAIDDGLCHSCWGRMFDEESTTQGDTFDCSTSPHGCEPRLLGPDAQTPHPDHNNP